MCVAPLEKGMNINDNLAKLGLKDDKTMLCKWVM